MCVINWWCFIMMVNGSLCYPFIQPPHQWNNWVTTLPGAKKRKGIKIELRLLIRKESGGVVFTEYWLCTTCLLCTILGILVPTLQMGTQRLVACPSGPMEVVLSESRWWASTKALSPVHLRKDVLSSEPFSFSPGWSFESSSGSSRKWCMECWGGFK
jgi:hypothetical protein